MPSPLTTVKTAYSYTAQFVGNTADPCFTKGKIYTSPSVYITGNSYFLDYSESQNSNDLKFLNQFFNGLTAGDTFGFSGGYYYNDTLNTKTEWSGVLQLSGKTGTFNQYLSCKGITNTAGLSAGYYSNKNFLNPFQFTAIKGTTANILVSYTPKNTPYNFEYLGIYGLNYGFYEYVELLQSSLNIGKLLVSNFIKLNDNTEVIYINSSVTDENLFFTKSTINLLQRGIPSLQILGTTQISPGVTKVTNKTSGQNTMLLDNQNQYQNYLRQDQDSLNYYYYYPNSSLRTLNSNTEEITDFKNLSLNYYKIFIVKNKTNIFINYNASGANITSLLSTNQYADTIYINETQGNILSVPNTYGISPIKLDFSDASNKGSIVEAFLDINCTQQLNENYYFIGSPGYEGCGFIYLCNRNTAPKTFFLKITKSVVNIIQVSFV